jgi:anthranilate phosphoribosyltransferase
VHGADGLDEISTVGYTKISECRDGAVNTFYVHPTDYGLPRARVEELLGGDAAANAAIARSVLAGERGPRRDVVLLNAAAALMVAGVVPAVGAGLQSASEAIDSGRAAGVLERLVALSRGAAA